MKIDKQNGNIAFENDSHTYWDIENNKKYVSVTTLIHQYTQEFDKNFWSAYKSLEQLIPKASWEIEKKSLLNTKKFDKELLNVYNISELEFNKVQQGILDLWAEENRKSCERGTKIHEEIEKSFYVNSNNISLQKFGLGGKFECRKDYTDLDLEYGVYPEYLIYRESDDGILRIAGQVDLIVKQGNEITVIDHKGLPLDTPILTSNGWSTMGNLKVGDKVYDRDGKLCNVTVKSEVHYNSCYRLTFNTGESIIADKDHRWLVGEDNMEFVAETTYIKFCMEEYPESLYYIPKATLPDISMEFPKEATMDRIITKVERVETVPTQCIMVDSPTHTYLVGKNLLVTHNTNKEIKTRGSYNTNTKSTVNMKYPLNNLPDVNFYHYTLQLSTYAWMLQKINPEFIIKDLILNHFDHKGNNTLYHCDYLKKDVERMLLHYKKKLILEEERNRRKRIEY